MSLHKSLVSKSALTKHRNVLSRAERIKALQEEDRWKDEMSVFGLPKVASRKLRKKAKVKTAEQVAAAAVAVEGEEKPPEAKSEREESKGKGKGKGKG